MIYWKLWKAFEISHSITFSCKSSSRPLRLIGFQNGSLILSEAKLRWRNFSDYTPVHRTPKHSQLSHNLAQEQKHSKLISTWKTWVEREESMGRTACRLQTYLNLNFSHLTPALVTDNLGCGESWGEITRHVWGRNVGSQENSHRCEETDPGNKNHLTNSTRAAKTRQLQNSFQLVTLLRSQLSLLMEKQSIKTPWSCSCPASVFAPVFFI